MLFLPKTPVVESSWSSRSLINQRLCRGSWPAENSFLAIGGLTHKNDTAVACLDNASHAAVEPKSLKQPKACHIPKDSAASSGHVQPETSIERSCAGVPSMRSYHWLVAPCTGYACQSHIQGSNAAPGPALLGEQWRPGMRVATGGHFGTAASPNHWNRKMPGDSSCGGCHANHFGPALNGICFELVSLIAGPAMVVSEAVAAGGAMVVSKGDGVVTVSAMEISGIWWGWAVGCPTSLQRRRLFGVPSPSS